MLQNAMNTELIVLGRDITTIGRLTTCQRYRWWNQKFPKLQLGSVSRIGILMAIPSEMELMIPINHSAYAGNTVFLSLYSIYIYLYNSLMENTSYFPDVNNYKNNFIYQEIQPPNLTVALTAKQPVISVKKEPPHKLSRVIRNCPISPNTTVIWGY